MIDQLKPGSNVRCTLVKVPRAASRRDTVQRLMQMDAGVQRGLRKAQRRRRQTLNVYVRGNRDWTSRVPVGPGVKLEAGATWTLAYSPLLAPDLRSVKDWVKVEKA